MIVLRYDNYTQLADLVRGSGNLLDEELLETAVVISLFTRRRADDSDVLPDPNGHREGWWADKYPFMEGDKYGSKLWLLSRSGLSQATLNQAKAYCEEALQWMIDDGIADEIAVIVDRSVMNREMLSVQVSIYKPEQPAAKWAGVWDVLLTEL